MEKRYSIALSVAVVALFVGLAWTYYGATPLDNNGGLPDNMIRLSIPQSNKIVASPLHIEGEARGTWYFEASFPIHIEDANGTILGQHYATAQEDWMTEDFVPFTAELTFSPPTTQTGTLVLSKDNPSGLPEHNDERRIPVKFDVNIAQRTVLLYYYNPDIDTDQTGNILCSRKGLVSVERQIPITQTPARDTLTLLLKGNLTQQEQEAGITTEFPLAEVEISNLLLNNGVLGVELLDPQGKTVGGACRTGILWFQIEATALQFPTIDSVTLLSKELFQP